MSLFKAAPSEDTQWCLQIFQHCMLRPLGVISRGTCCCGGAIFMSLSMSWGSHGSAGRATRVGASVIGQVTETSRAMCNCPTTISHGDQ